MHNSEAFDRLWKAAQNSVRRTIATVGRGLSTEDREDAELGARLRMWRSFSQYDPTLSGSVAWACMIARAETLDACRRACRGIQSRTEDLSGVARQIVFEGLADDAPSALEGLLVAELGERINAAIHDLTPRQGKALRLVAGGMSCREAAVTMGTSHANVAHAAREARGKVALALAA